jgi:hypothetical protein
VAVTDLQEHIKLISHKPHSSLFIKVQLFCFSSRKARRQVALMGKKMLLSLMSQFGSQFPRFIFHERHSGHE